MPTYETLPHFTTDLDRLTPEQRRRFRQVVAVFVDDLRAGAFRTGLREGCPARPGVFELTWDGDGRATWFDGPQIIPGERHIVWRRSAHTTSSPGPEPPGWRAEGSPVTDFERGSIRRRPLRGRRVRMCGRWRWWAS